VGQDAVRNGAAGSERDVDFTGAKAIAAKFARAALTLARLERFAAKEAVFAFAALRGAKMSDADFTYANLIGACLHAADAARCAFHGADFYWAEIDTFIMALCNTMGARFPEKVEIAYGPKGVRSPEVKLVPLYHTAATATGRRKLLEVVQKLTSSRLKEPQSLSERMRITDRSYPAELRLGKTATVTGVNG
jgi:Pentapeptide repeats (8 copies)